jgi:predicted site-specific integrase-resolvase
MNKIMKLSQYAKMMGVTYVTAYRWFERGKLKNAFQTDSSSIFVNIIQDNPEKIKENVLIYCRVSNQSRKKEMEFQVNRCVEFCNARGLQVNKIYKEVASGMNDNRKIFWKMLENKPSIVVVENKDRLTRFGFTYLERLLKNQGCELLVMNPNKDDEQDLMKDLVSIITSFCCRLYGLRRMKNKLDKIKQVLSDNTPEIDNEKIQ